MKQEKPKMIKCATCGYEWQQGTDGTHSCIEGLQRELRRVRGVAVRLIDATDNLINVGCEFCDMDMGSCGSEAIAQAEQVIAELKEVLA